VRSRGKRKFEIGREPADTHLAPVRGKKIRTNGGNEKIRLFRCDIANVTILYPAEYHHKRSDHQDKFGLGAGDQPARTGRSRQRCVGMNTAGNP